MKILLASPDEKSAEDFIKCVARAQQWCDERNYVVSELTLYWLARSFAKNAKK